MWIFRGQFRWSPSPNVHFAIAMIMAVAALVLCAVLFYQARADVAKATLVEGVVVKSLVVGDATHIPVISYIDAAGQQRLFKSNLSTTPQRYFKGDRVQVMLSGVEGRPKLKNLFTVYGLAGFAGLFSLICFIGATAVYYTRIRGHALRRTWRG